MELNRHNRWGSGGGTSPWKWIPTLYFAEGLPNIAVMALAVVFYTRMGLSVGEMALYTSWLYLPWVIKPLWSPLVDLVKTNRWWIVAMQAAIGAGFAGIALFIPTGWYLQLTLAFFWLLAFSSATHDIAADGFYMKGLDEGQQSFFVGIRTIFYRFSTIFGQGFLVMLAGWLEQGKLLPSLAGKIPVVWSLVFYLLAALFIFFSLYHKKMLPRPVVQRTGKPIRFDRLWQEFTGTFVSFFRKKGIGTALFFLLTYRLGESQLVKITAPFLLGERAAGGMGLTTAELGMVYGTLGVIALLTGGILGGILISRHGLGYWLLPMAFAINLPDLLYVGLAAFLPDHLYLVAASVIIEQLGYGFGFTAYMMFLIYLARGPQETAHYAIGTGFMALGLMLPGMVAGFIQEHLGYTLFFSWVCISTLPGIVAAGVVRRKIPKEFGRKV